MSKVKIYTTQELAETLGCTSATLVNEFNRGNIKGFKVGRDIKFTQYHVDDYLNIKNFGKTQRELELEEEIEQLKQELESKEKLMTNIKDLLLRGPDIEREWANV